MHSIGISINLFTLLILVVLLSKSVYSGEPSADCKGDGFPEVKGSVVDFTKEDLEAARKIALETHNEFRKQHGAPPMTLSDDLNDKAQRSADCSIKWETRQRLSNGESYVAKVLYGDITGHEIAKLMALAKTATEMWYSPYCWGSTPTSKDSGAVNPQTLEGSKYPYYRIVWKSTTQVGFGFARGPVMNKDGGYRAVVLARYSTSEYPPGGEDKEVSPMSAKLDNVACCRNKDSSTEGRFWKLVTKYEKQPENCVVLKESENEDGDGGTDDKHPVDDTFIEPPGDCKGDAWPPVKDIVLDPHTKEALEEARQTVLEAHNQWRHLHGARPLKLRDDLNEKAQHLAECSVKWETWKRVSNGESYFSGIHPQDPHPKLERLQLVVSDHWYSPYCRGLPHTNDNDNTTDTQEIGKTTFYRVAWKSTSSMGIGFARSAPDKDGKFRAVALARYSTSEYPAGEEVKQVKVLSTALDNVVCCRSKDPAKGQLYKLVGKDHEDCVVTKLPENEEGDGENGGGSGNNNCNDVGGWWPGFLNFKFPWNSNGAGWWGYSGFHANENSPSRSSYFWSS